MKQTLIFCLFFIGCLHIGNAQELLTSNNAENAISEPFTYIVKPGDTKYSLAKRFGIDITALENQNPQIVPMLKVDEVLQIHTNKDRTELQEIETYVVKSGDTKFGLSKRFHVSIEQLERWNPHIVPNLLIGQALSLSSKNSAPLDSVSENFEEGSQTIKNKQQTDGYIFHTIQSGETLFGLAKKAGMSIPTFLGLNPKLSNSVQAGMIIKMPFGNEKPTSLYTDLRKTLSKEKKKNLTFLLPFSKTEFSDEKRNKDGLSQYLKDNRDFYSGALIAIDSAKSLGLNITFDIVNTNTLSADSKNETVISSDAIILPYFQKSLYATIETFDSIPIIIISKSSENFVNLGIFEAVPSPYAQRKTMLDYLSSKNDGNLIVISDESRDESRTHIRNHTPEAKFLSVKENGVWDSEDLVKTLRKNVRNYVILDTDKNGVFISATNVLLKELSNYEIQLVVLESSLIPDRDDVSRKRFVILDMLYPSISNGNSYSQKKFNEHYTKQFSSEPTTMSTYGFDITFDTLLRLFQSEAFEKASEKITEYNVLKFQYSKNDKGNHSNFGVHILEYETHDNHKQIN